MSDITVMSFKEEMAHFVKLEEGIGDPLTNITSVVFSLQIAIYFTTFLPKSGKVKKVVTA